MSYSKAFLPNYTSLVDYMTLSLYWNLITKNQNRIILDWKLNGAEARDVDWMNDLYVSFNTLFLSLKVIINRKKPFIKKVSTLEYDVWISINPESVFWICKKEFSKVFTLKNDWLEEFEMNLTLFSNVKGLKLLF